MNIRDEIEERGFAFERGALSPDRLERLLLLVSNDQGGVRSRRGSSYAVRNLLWECPAIGEVLIDLGVNRLATQALGRSAFAINVMYFDKNPGANWAVPGHQDRMMPVESEVAEPGFSGWSTKFGILHVEPPVEVLSKLVALRIHFDACPPQNGALAVVPGSHANKLRDADIAAISAEDFTICEAAAGDVLLMKPLIVHRSSPAKLPGHRRVLHIVYACEEPGKQLRWKRPA